MTCLMAFDTSTDEMTLTLKSPTQFRCVQGEAGAAASARMLPQAQILLAEAGLTWADVDGVAFGCGPGAFTGLRTSCSVVQGLALGLGKPVLAVDSLMLVAHDAWLSAQRPPVFDVWVAMDARMGEVYAARYSRRIAGWHVERAPFLSSPEVINEVWHGSLADSMPVIERCVVVGSALNVFAALHHPAAQVASWGQARAQALAELSDELWKQGHVVFDAAQALPVYVRHRVAQTTQERAMSRMGQLREV